MPEIEDDHGTTFGEEQQAPLTEELQAAAMVRPLTDAHFMMVMGVLFSLVAVLMPATTAWSTWRFSRERMIVMCVVAVVGASARYLGLGPEARLDRRAL